MSVASPSEVLSSSPTLVTPAEAQVEIHIGTPQQQQPRNGAWGDRDRDGIPNAYDPYPLSYDTPVVLSGYHAAGQTMIALRWQAAPNSNYQVEYATDLLKPVWQPLSTFSNTASTPQTATAQDSITNDHEQRYYRVRTQ